MPYGLRAYLGTGCVDIWKSPSFSLKWVMVHLPQEPPPPHPGRADAHIRVIPMDDAIATLLTPLQKGALWAQIVFYCVTAVSILAAGGIGIVKYRLFRSGRPFITVSLDASSRPCSERHIQVGVTAQLYNGSKVLAKADVLEWECRVLATYDADEIEAKISEYFSYDDGVYSRLGGENTEFPWNVRQRIRKTCLGMKIEPNETAHESVSFILPWDCAAVQIGLFIPVGTSDQSVWTAVIYHDTRTAPEEQEAGNVESLQEV